MNSENSGRQLITVSISEDNYQSIKKCADVMGLNLSLVIDKMIANKIPGDGGINRAEFFVMDALATASVNFTEKDFKQLLENLIGIFGKLKNADNLADASSDYLSRMKLYLI